MNLSDNLKPISIHISDVRSFRSCRRRWQWSSSLGRNLEPVVPYIPFFTGRAIHNALEDYYRSGTSFPESITAFLKLEHETMEQNGTLWPEEEMSFADQELLIRGLLWHYKLWVDQDKQKYSDANLEFIEMETEFEVPMPTLTGRPAARMTFGGRFDGLVRHKETGALWIYEAKTTRSIEELVRSLANDEQCGAYLYAAKQMYKEPIAGVLYNVMRKKLPTIPNRLQSGSLSKNSSIDTTWFAYRQSILDLYPDWSDETIEEMYGDMHETLAPNARKFFMRYPVYKSDSEIKMLMQGVYNTGREMINSRTRIYPAPGWLSCNFCHFKSPCLAMNAGSDYEVLLREEYQPRISFTSMRDKLDDQSTN